MLTYLRSLAARLRHRLESWGPPPDEPYSPVREPRSRTPGGRSSAVAVAEPDAPIRVRAVSTFGARGPTPDS